MTRVLGPGKSGNSSGVLGHFVSSWLGVHYAAFVESMFLSYVILNIMDLWTSAVALGRGLEEGNWIVVALSNFLGVWVFNGLALIKIVAVSGGLIVAMMGIRTKNQAVRKGAFAVMAFMTLVVLAVSVNNLVVLGF